MDDIDNVFEKLKCADEIVDDVSKDYLGFQNFQRLQCACCYIGEALSLLRAHERAVPEKLELSDETKSMA